MMKERFWSKVKRTPHGCWEWQANKNNKGYGMFQMGRLLGKQLAHRVSYEMENGPIPSGMIVRHSCDNPACVNPGHLLLGTQKLNVQDAIERNRHVNPPDMHSNPAWRARHFASVQRGEAHVQSKLTEPVVREIWRLHLKGQSAAAIASAVGFSRAVVHDVCRGRSWRHLPDAPSIETLKSGGVRRGFNQFSQGGVSRDLHPGTKIPLSDLDKILERRKNGDTMDVIGETYGVKKSAVSRYLKNHAPYDSHSPASRRP